MKASVDTFSSQLETLANWLWRADVRFEDVALSHLDSKKMVVVLLGLLVRCVLGEERLGYLLEIVERLQRQGIELI